jgi:NADP-reducing hydrogenase subunit HndD
MAEYQMLINANTVAFTPGQTILAAAKAADIWIPTLCHLKGATPTGACRICVVELEGARSLQAACSTPAAPGMKVQTESKRVVEARRLVLELLIASGNHNCAVHSGGADWTDFQLRVAQNEGSTDLCPVWGDCKLQELAFRYQVKPGRFAPQSGAYPTELANPLIVRDFSRCIMCGRCVQACNEVQVNLAISHGYRGERSKIVASGDRPLADSDCVFCGECIQACPVGALVEKKSRYQWRPWQETTVRTTCPYCGVGCQLLLRVQNERIVKLAGVEGAEPNQGRLCVKGRFGYDFIYSEERLKTPLIREKNGFREASWDEALDLVVDRFKQISAESGPDALAGVSCARSLNEDSYQMQKLFRAVFKTNNVDHCART